MRPKLYILRGAPGAGKSTLARKMLLQGIVDKHYEADMWFHDSEGRYIFDGQRLPEVHSECQRATYNALNAGFNVVVANCFMKASQIQTYVDFGFETEVIHLRGQHQNVHGLSQDRVEAIRSRMEPWPLDGKRIADLEAMEARAESPAVERPPYKNAVLEARRDAVRNTARYILGEEFK